MPHKNRAQMRRYRPARCRWPELYRNQQRASQPPLFCRSPSLRGDAARSLLLVVAAAAKRCWQLPLLLELLPLLLIANRSSRAQRCC
jgi:hypothetical protein